MSDIDISFSSNAVETSRGMDTLTGAVGKTETQVKTAVASSQNLSKAFAGLGGRAGTIASGLGRAFGMGGGMGVALAGFIALRKTLEITDYMLNRHKAMVKAAGEAHIEMAHNIRRAAEMQSSTGLSASGSQGSNILALVGKGGGGLDVANQLAKSKGLDLGDAQEATLAAQQRFKGNWRQGLEIAARAAAAGGGSATENIHNLDPSELGNPGLAAARLLAAHRGDASFSEKELKETEGRIGASSLGSSVLRNRRGEATIGVAQQELIPQAGRALSMQFTDTVNPIARMISDQQTTKNEEISVLKRIADSQGYLEKIYDIIRNPQSNASFNANRATNIQAAGSGT